MKLDEYIRVMRPEVETSLQKFIACHGFQDYPELREMLAYHMGWEGDDAGPDAQGKRIRPLLVLLCAEAAGGEWRNALPAANAVELLHNFSLVHDDIQDHSPLRRNRPTVWVKWGAPQAINLGDVLFTLSMLAVHDLSATLPPQKVLTASRILLETCLRLTEGQYLDISYETRPVLPLEAYWPMIGGKTSALLSSCCELGAIAGGADEERRKAFRDYGYSLGLAFQVLDDWLGIWGEPEQIGKSTESDLVSGKKTLPVLYGISKDGAFARRWMQGHIVPEEVPGLSQLLEEEGAYDKTLEKAAHLTGDALRALEQATGNAPGTRAAGAAQALLDLSQVLLQRRR